MDDKKLYKIIKDHCASKGFKASEKALNIFYSSSHKVTNWIGFVLEDDETKGNIIVQFWLGKRVSDVESFWEDYRAYIGLGKQPPPLTLSYVKGGVDKIDDEVIDIRRVCLISYNSASFESDFRAAINNILNSCILFFEKFNNVENLDNLLNSPPERYEDIYFVVNPYGLMFRKMIVSYLARNPDFHKICELVLDRIKKTYGPEKIDKYLKIYESLMSKFIDPVS